MTPQRHSPFQHHPKAQAATSKSDRNCSVLGLEASGNLDQWLEGLDIIVEDGLLDG